MIRSYEHNPMYAYSLSVYINLLLYGQGLSIVLDVDLDISCDYMLPNKYQAVGLGSRKKLNFPQITERL